MVDGVPVWVDESGNVKGRAAPGKVPTRRDLQSELLEAYLRRMHERELEDGEDPEQKTPLLVYYIAAEVGLNGRHPFNAVITNEEEHRVEIAGINTHAPDPVIVVSGVSLRDIQS